MKTTAKTAADSLCAGARGMLLDKQRKKSPLLRWLKNSNIVASLYGSVDGQQDFAKNCTNSKHKNIYRNFFVASEARSS